MKKLTRFWQIIVTITAFSSGILLLSVATAKEEEDAEHTISIESVPNSVQAAIKAESHGANVTAVTKESDDGFITYEAEYEAEEVSRSVKISENGIVLERETEVAPESLPADVLAQIRKEFPKATIKVSEEVNSTYYEVIINTGKKEKEIKVFANGQPMDEEDE